MSIALIVLALDPLWVIGAMLIHPALLIPSYALWGIFNSGWNIAQNLVLVRTTGHAAERIRALVTYNVAFGLAAGVAPWLGGAILETLDGRYPATVAFGVLFATALVLRLSAFRFLRDLPAPPSERGRYVSAVVLRAVRRRARLRTRAIVRLGLTVGSAITSTVTSTVETTIEVTVDVTAGAARGIRNGARRIVNE
jgi:MFS family permease